MPLNPPNVVRTPEGYRPEDTSGSGNACCGTIPLDFLEPIPYPGPGPDPVDVPYSTTVLNIAAGATFAVYARSTNPPNPPTVVTSVPVVTPSNGLTPGVVAGTFTIVPNATPPAPGAIYEFVLITLSECGCAGFVADISIVAPEV